MNRRSRNTQCSYFLHRGLSFLAVLALVLGGLPATPAQIALAEPEAPDAVTYNGLSLTGADTYVIIPHDSELNTVPEITIEAWVFRNTTARHESLVGNGWKVSYWLGFSPEGKMRFVYNNAAQLESNSVVPAGEWNHVAMTFDGSHALFYINGVLDKSTSTAAGPIAANPTDPLYIGHDSDLTTDKLFDGIIDEVRIWNEVRTPAEIQANIFLSFPSYPSALIGYWKLNGNALDATGGHNGSLSSGLGYTWVNEGALPKDIRIPLITTTPSLDGVCGTTEYSNAVFVSLEGVQMTIQHTDTHLWVCFNFGLATGFTRAYVLLDPGLDRTDGPQPDDYRLMVNYLDGLTTYVGTGTGWVPGSSTQWDAEWGSYYQGDFLINNAEFKIESALAGESGSVNGLALDPFDPINDTYPIDTFGIWPTLSESGKPSTWSRATLADVGPTRTFTGYVKYQPKDLAAPQKGTNGAGLNLYGYDTYGSELLVATTSSFINGYFTLTTNDDFSKHRLELGLVPQGYTSESATASSPGVVVDSRTIDYGAAAGGTYSSNLFILGDPIPYNPSAVYGPVFLIVAPQWVITAGALDEFRDFKQQQGYSVAVRSLEDADKYAGATRLEKVRAMEQDYLEDYGDRFQFVMLVGEHDVIPFAKITPYATGVLPVCPSEDPKNYKYTDWLYVDITSPLDTNGNGCYLDGLLSKSSERALYYQPDTFAWDPTVTVGRIPFSDPDMVHDTLGYSIGFEKQSESYKQEVLAGMSLVALKGYFDGLPCENQWGHHCVYPHPNTVSSYDTSLLSEEMEADFLEADLFTTTKLYENEEAVAGGQGIITDPDLTQENILATLDGERFGLAVMSGHGNSSAVYRTFWEEDKNHNGMVDVSDNETLQELAGASFFHRLEVLGQTDPEGNRGSVYVLLACSTASPTDASNLAATIISEGHGPAVAASLSVAGVGNWFNEGDGNVETVGYYIINRLVHNNYRMGEAVWWTLADLILKGKSGSGGVTFDLYGDPTLNFFGNPGGETDLDPWPMGRRDSSGSSYTNLYGPTIAKKIWEYPLEGHAAQTYGPTPVVSAKGEVIAVSGNHVDILRNGSLYQQLSLDAAVFGSPALSADGTIYVMDVDANLYAFPNKRITFNGHTVVMNDHVRRWKVDIGENPQASPVIGPDGFIVAGVGGAYAEHPSMSIVRPDGQISHAIDLDPYYLPLNYAAVDTNRHIYMTTEGSADLKGRLYHLVPFCDTLNSVDVCPYAAESSLLIDSLFTTAPLLWKGSVYAGAFSNKIYQIDKLAMTIKAQMTIDGSIKLGPVGSPNGDIVFVTNNGTLYSVTPNLTSVRWQKNLGTSQLYGIPAVSSNGIYLAFDGYLRAYNPNSGVEIWKISLGSVIEDGTVSIGYGRELYVEGAAGGQVIGFSSGWAVSPAAVQAFPGISSGRIFNDIYVHFDIDSVITDTRVTSAAPVDLSEILEINNPMDDSQSEIEAVDAATIIAILLERSEDGQAWEEVGLFPPETTTFRDTNIEPDTAYLYRAQYLMSDGTFSEFTSTPEVVYSLPQLPEAPILDETYAISAESIELIWEPAYTSVYDNFSVERATAPAGPFSEVDSLTGASTTWADSGLTPGTAYYYRVIGSNDAGASAPSNVRSATTFSQTLEPPTNFHAERPANGEVFLTWDPGPADATAVLEVITMDEYEYSLLGDTPAADGYFSYPLGEPGGYGYRMKYVRGNTESTYVSADVGIWISPYNQVYLPLVIR